MLDLGVFLTDQLCKAKPSILEPSNYGKTHSNSQFHLMTTKTKHRSTNTTNSNHFTKVILHSPVPRTVSSSVLFHRANERSFLHIKSVQSSSLMERFDEISLEEITDKSITTSNSLESFIL